MACPDVYLLALHEPYEEPRHPVPINATIVHALTLLHPRVPQPDGGMTYRCLTEFPVRKPGCVVPLSTLTFELDGGLLWQYIGDWEAVADAVANVAQQGECDAMPLGLPQVATILLANGPNTTTVLHMPDGTTKEVGPAERHAELEMLTAHLRAVAEEAVFWPGDNLVAPPAEPQRLPYQPCRLPYP